MAYDEELAERLRHALDGEEGISEKRMFGGLAFLVHGNMAIAASGQGGLMVRIDPGEAESLTQAEEVSRMEMRGRRMDGWLRVGAAAVESADDLQRWSTSGSATPGPCPPSDRAAEGVDFEHVFYSARVQRFHEPPDSPARVFHVWVKLDLDGPRAPLPGLVLDWRQTAAGWEAWVVTVETYSTGTGHGSMVRQGWRPLRYLRPAGSRPPALADWNA